MSSHRRSVFGFLVSLYLCTVPVALGLIALVSPVTALRLGLPFHTLFIVPLAIIELRSHAAVE